MDDQRAWMGSARVSTQSIKTVAAASFIGTTIEWYDFFLYGTAAALVFGDLFFPDAEPLIGTLLALSTYAVGFAARPLGGIVFGHFGDRVGRKSMLVHLAADHGRGDVPDRLSADLQLDRHPGADPARDAAVRAGHRRRRRVGRRGADGGRARAQGPPRLLRLVAADGRPGRPADLDARVQARQQQHVRGGIRELGLAHPVPGQRDPRDRRPGDPPEADGVAGVRARQGDQDRGRGSRSSTSSASTRATCSPRWACGWARTASSTC